MLIRNEIYIQWIYNTWMYNYGKCDEDVLLLYEQS